jgi:SAM-dependent methyltransferase
MSNEIPSSQNYSIFGDQSRQQYEEEKPTFQPGPQVDYQPPVNKRKLNLGCGQHKAPGYINIDKEVVCSPDMVLDLEQFPWPFEDDSIDEILMSHTLEHLGQDQKVFYGIMKEMYRISAPNATLIIVVPHPRHDNFINGPDHVRIISPAVISLFSKKLNREWAANRGANTTLGLYLDIDFEIEAVSYVMATKWREKYEAGIYTDADMAEAVDRYNNVVEEIQMKIRAVKEPVGSRGYGSIFS